MIKPNWNIFKAKFSENPQKNFEWFSYLLFCKEFNRAHGIFRYKNQSAIETDPIEIEDEVIGWQAKFYEDTLSNHKSDLLSTLAKAKRDYPSITKVIFYTNSEWGQGRGNSNDPQAKIDLEKKAKELGMEIVWNTASFFESPFVSLEQEIISSYFFSESPLIDLSPQKGWYPYENWSNATQGIEEEYIVSDQTVIINDLNETKPIIEGLNELRTKLQQEKSVVRLVGLSGVGKTRFVQAIFDERIGTNIPESSRVCYTDISRNPDPSPLVMAEQLLEIGEQAILIVDNCPPDLHRELVKTVTKDDSQLSLLTVEYDVRDDLPEETDVYKLEPNSLEVIEKIIDQRFEHISQIDARSIAEFSGGNARIALALANTIQKDETLSGLKDEELFKRLFQQRNDPNDSLIQSAEVLSLVYSFNAKETDDSSELAFLSKLIGKNTIDLYRDIEILRKRDLIQVRGDWKAVLPQAISNRLAKQALDSMPQDYIVEQFLNYGTERLIKSFAHRLSFLHDSKVAINISEDWLKKDGWLGKNMCNFNEFGMSIFKSIAPVTPERALECMEKTAASKGVDFLDPERNRSSAEFIEILRHIAYDPKYFDRAVKLILKFVLLEKKKAKYNTLEEITKSLFWLLLSGTHATPEQRAEIIKALLQSKDEVKQDIGFALLEAALETYHFTSHFSFDFGARSRDFGWQPKTIADQKNWYQIFIKIGLNLALSNHRLSKKARKLVANKFRGLWSRSSNFDLLEEMAKKLHDQEPWSEGWIAINETIRFDRESYDPEILKKIIRIKEYLKPSSLYGKASVYIVPGQHYSSDCFDLQDKDKQGECQKLLNHEVFEIGKKLALDEKTFLSLLPKMVISDNYMLGTLIQGVATAYPAKKYLWELIYNQYKHTPKEKWQLGVIQAILLHWSQVDSNFFNELMDQLIDDEIFAAHYPGLQMLCLDKIGITRLHKAIDLNIAPLWQYRNLAYGRRHEVLNDDDLHGIIEHILLQENSLDVALEILSMRFHGKSKEKHSHKLIDMGYKILIEYPYIDKEESRNGHNDHSLEIVASTCFENKPIETMAATICKNIADRQSISLIPHFPNTLKVLAKYFPKVFLDCCFDNNFIVSKGIRRLSTSYSLEESNSIYDEIDDKYILEWVEENPELRAQFIASVINPLDIIEDDLTVKPLLYAILDKSNNKIDVLENLLSFRSSWSFTSQRFENFDSKKVLLQELKMYDNKDISNWANEQLDNHLLEMERICDIQKNESKSKFERFE